MAHFEVALHLLLVQGVELIKLVGGFGKHLLFGDSVPPVNSLALMAHHFLDDFSQPFRRQRFGARPL
jgi:hypothetical protein